MSPTIEDKIRMLDGFFNQVMAETGQMIESLVDSKLQVSDFSFFIASPDDARNAMLYGKKAPCLSTVCFEFEGTFSGYSTLVFSSDDISKLVTFVLGDAAEGLSPTEAKEEVLREIGNITVNGVTGLLSNEVEGSVEFSPPIFSEGVSYAFQDVDLPTPMLCAARSKFLMEKFGVTCELHLMFSLKSIDTLISKKEAMAPALN